MRPVTLAALLAISATASAQTLAPFEVGLAVSRSPTVAGTAGDENTAGVSAAVLAVDASGRVWRREGVDVRVGGVLRAAATDFFLNDGLQGPELHHLGAYVAAGTTVARGGRAELLAGLSLDLGPDLFDDDAFADDPSFSTDAQDALWLGGRYATVASGLTLDAGAEAFLTRRRSVTVPYTTVEDPDGSDSTLTFLTDFGDAFNAHLGVSRRVGPINFGLALQVSGRTESYSELVGDPRPPVRNRGAQVWSVVPSVTYRAPSGLDVELAMQAPGVLTNEHAVHGIPLLVRRARVGAVPLSLRVGYRW